MLSFCASVTLLFESVVIGLVSKMVYVAGASALSKFCFGQWAMRCFRIGSIRTGPACKARDHTRADPKTA